jgi:hypothetical protein
MIVGSFGAMNLQLYQAARMQQNSYAYDDEDDHWWRR